LSANFKPQNIVPVINLKYASNLSYLMMFLLLKVILIWQLFEPVDMARYWRLDYSNKKDFTVFFTLSLYLYYISLKIFPLFLAFSLSGFLFACTPFLCFYFLKVMQDKQIQPSTTTFNEGSNYRTHFPRLVQCTIWYSDIPELLKCCTISGCCFFFFYSWNRCWNISFPNQVRRRRRWNDFFVSPFPHFRYSCGSYSRKPWMSSLSVCWDGFH
jgi:hypothetical protein